MTSHNFNDKFEYPVLTKILGMLDYPKINKLKDELKINASSIHSDLGGGMNGHLGLILTDVEYENVDDEPYKRHINPPLLIIQNKTQQHEANRWRVEHKEAKGLF